MGASFIFCTANVTKPKEYWLDYISHMDDSHMDSFITITDEEFYWADRFDHPANDLYSHAFYQKVAEVIVEAVNVSYDYEYNLEIGWFEHADETLIVTGGMSWGDDPTDALDKVAIFHTLQHWDKHHRNKEN